MLKLDRARDRGYLKLEEVLQFVESISVSLILNELKRSGFLMRISEEEQPPEDRACMF